MANEVVIHVKADGNPDRDVDRMAKRTETTAKRSFLRSGGHAGAAFMAGFIKTITLGQVGSGFAMAATKLKPQMAHIGGGLGVALAAGVAVKLANVLKGLLPLALGGAILALPIIGILKKQISAQKDLEKIGLKIAAVEDRIKNSKGEARKEAEKELEILKGQQKELEKQAEHLIRLEGKFKKFMAEIAKPVESPLFKSMRLVGDTLDEWGPKFRKAIAPLAKELPGFVEGALGGIENFAKEIGKEMPSITAGFKEWGKQLPGIGRALGKMVGDWIDSAPETIERVQETARAFEDLAEAVGAVGRAFRRFNQINAAFVEIRDNQEKMLDGFRGRLVRGISSAARRAASSFRENMNDIIPAGRRIASQVASAIRSGMSRMASAVSSGASRVAGLFRSLGARIRGAFAGAGSWLVSAGRRLITGLVAGIRSAAGAAASAAANVVRNAINAARSLIPGRAAGGPVWSQAAAGGAKGGMVLVGERGPEVVQLPGGSHVFPNGNTAGMLQRAGKGGGDTYITVNAPNYVGAQSDLIRALVDAKRRGQLDVVFR